MSVCRSCRLSTRLGSPGGLEVPESSPSPHIPLAADVPSGYSCARVVQRRGISRRAPTPSRSAGKGAHVPNKEALINAPLASRGTYLQKALWQGQMPFSILLFAYCVAAYRLKPTKTKAIFIWNKFLKALDTRSEEEERRAAM